MSMQKENSKTPKIMPPPPRQHAPRRLFSGSSSDSLHHDSGDGSEEPASAEYVLNVAFFSFVGFVIFESVFALIANSQSMLADAEAMSIDAMTYLFNLAAEKLKHRPLSAKSLRLPPQEQAYQRELRRLYLELIPPTISVVALIIITIVTLVQAFESLGKEFEMENEEDDDVSVPIMLLFSGANLLLDIVNVTCFARANATFGLDVVGEESKQISQTIGNFDVHLMTEEGSHLLAAAVEDSKEPSADVSAAGVVAADLLDITQYGTLLQTQESPPSSHESSTDECPRPDQLINLNMCSAWTHVCADTLRSTAVLIAAAIATLLPQVSGETADAAAAVAVSIIILASLIPLIQGLILTALAIQDLHAHPEKASLNELG